MYVRKLSLTGVAEQIGVGTVTAIVVAGQAGLTQPCCSLPRERNHEFAWLD